MRYPFSNQRKQGSMILAFLAGAGVFGIGMLTGATLVQSSFDKVLNSTDDAD